MTSIFEVSTGFILRHLDIYREGKDDDKHAPLLVMISGPQGSGKTFSSRAIKHNLEKQRPHLRTVCVSIDDFYLTHADQLAVSSSNSGNKLLQGRGLPGTHDMRLLESFMHALHKNQDSVSIPSYDKSLFNGEGDRAAGTHELQLPVDVVIVEGWFLGFRAVGADRLESMQSESTSDRGKLLRTHDLHDLLQVDASIHNYARLLWDNGAYRSLGVVISADIAKIYQWRQQQEAQMIAEQGRGMSEDQVRAFVLRYMPCYEVYYPALTQQGDLGTDATLVVQINADRSVASTKEKIGSAA